MDGPKGVLVSFQVILAKPGAANTCLQPGGGEKEFFLVWERGQLTPNCN